MVEDGLFDQFPVLQHQHPMAMRTHQLDGMGDEHDRCSPLPKLMEQSKALALKPNIADRQSRILQPPFDPTGSRMRG